MVTVKTHRPKRMTPGDQLIADAVRKGVIPPSRARLYRRMMKKDPVNTRRLLIRLSRVIK